MTITYAIFSILCGAIGAALAWIESGPLLAAVAYVVVGSIALLGLAFFAAGRPPNVSLVGPFRVGHSGTAG